MLNTIKIQPGDFNCMASPIFENIIVEAFLGLTKTLLVLKTWYMAAAAEAVPSYNR